MTKFTMPEEAVRDAVEDTGLTPIDRIRLELHLSNEYKKAAEFDADDVEELLKAYDALLTSLQEWRGIESAPKDGTEVLLWWPDYKLDDADELTDEVVGGTRVIGNFVGVWQEAGGLEGHGMFFGDDSEPGHEPTLWMPLPTPPSIEKSGGEK